MNPEVLEKHIKNEKLKNLYLLYGAESYRKSRFCRLLREKAVGGMENFNLHVFDMDHFDLERLHAALDNLPMMSERKCVILRDIDPDELKTDAWKELLAVLKDLPEDVVMVLYYDAVRYDKKSSRWKSLLAAAEKSGVAVEVGPASRSEIERILRERAKKAGCSLSAENAGCLIDICGTDLNTLLHELDKLCAYTGSGEIRKESIQEAAARPLESTIYDLAEEVVKGHAEQALLMLDSLFLQKVEPVIILSAFTGEFCDLYRAKIAKNAGRRQAEVEADFPYQGRGFRVRKALQACSGVSVDYLRQGLSLLMKADGDVKSSRMDNRVILERLIVELLRLKPGRQRI